MNKQSLPIGKLYLKIVFVVTCLLSALVLPAPAAAIDSCSIVSGCPTGDATQGVDFTGLQPADLQAGTFRVTATGSDGYSCSYGSGTADNSSYCDAYYDTSDPNIECYINHLDCRNNPFSISVSAPAGYSCSPSDSSVNLANCANNDSIVVNCTAPVCESDGSCDAAAPACGSQTTGEDNCGDNCTRTGPACPIYGSICTAISVNSGNAVTSGQSYSATVSMKNPENTNTRTYKTWTTADGYKLGSSNPRGNTVWGLNRVALPSSPITPGNTATFNFNVTAPTVTAQSTKSFYWEMVQENVDWFGAQCQYNVTVNPPPASLEVSCSPSSTTANIGNNVAWTSTRTGGTSPFTYSWNFGSDYTCVTPSSNCTTSQNPTVKYNSAGTRSVTVTTTDSSNPVQSVTSSNCSVNITTPFDYSMSNGGNKTVARGNSVNNSIGVNLVAGTTQLVSLSASGFPAGVTHSFSPTSCSPNCSSTLSMTASSTATTGVSTITVTGTAGSLTKTTTFTLTVTTPPATCGNGTCSGGETCSTCSADCGACPAPPPPPADPPPPPPPPPGAPPPPPPPPPPAGGCPYIQTTGGDVHSNTNINTPC